METAQHKKFDRKLWFCRVLELIAVGVLIYFFSWFFHNPFCGFIFQCGCTFAGTPGIGWKHCNVHNVSGPKCPWCNAKKNVVWLVDTNSVNILMFISYLIAAIYQWKKVDQRRQIDNIYSDLVAYNEDPEDITTNNAVNNRKWSVHSDRNDHKLCNIKPILKRLWIPFFVFTIYDLILGIIFYFATNYPYFMWFKK